jgi:hypothetical protein
MGESPRGIGRGPVAAENEQELSKCQEEITALRRNNFHLERRLALEEQRSAHVSEIECSLADREEKMQLLVEARAAAEKEWATASERFETRRKLIG